MVLSNRAAAGYVNGPPPSMRDVTARKPARKKKRFPIWAGVLAATLIVGIVVGGYFAMPYINIVSSSTGQQATQFNTTTSKNKGSAPQMTNADSGPILSKPTNILLLGSDTDAKFDGTYLAQTDIILRIDPTTKYVGMLSIPRDLQVDIPGYPANKLDWAFSYGYQSKKTNNPYADGAGLAIATIEQNFGIPIDGYAWVGLDGFIKVIDTAGGVDVDVLHPMVDDTYPDDVNAATGQTHANLNQAFGYKRLYIAPGPQHFNGVQALEYVRTRHSDLVGDFGRSVRQQQVLNQLKSRLETPDTVAKLPELATDLNGYVKTSLSLADLASLANFARTINSNSIDRLVLGPPYSVEMKNSSNFAPVCDKIIPAIQKMFGLGGQANCIPQASANTAGVASSSIPSGTATNQNTATSRADEAMTSAAVINQLARTNMLSVGSTHGDPFGVECLLDLTLMVALESFDAMTTT
jgi:LCP family protein required for cell wall assembly